MANTRHYIDGRKVDPPREWEELAIERDWEDEKEMFNVNIQDISFVLEPREYLKERILNGLTGGVGITEGVPYRIEVGRESNPSYVFDGYLDLTDRPLVLGNEEITLSLKKRKSKDWLNDVADGFSFAYLRDQGIITDGDFVKVPYVINYIPDGLELIVLSMSIYMMTKESVENVLAISEGIADLANGAPDPGVGFGANAGGPIVVSTTTFKVAWFVLTGLKVAARIAYGVAMVIAIKNLIENLLNQILPPKRDHLGIRLRTMMDKGCENLGLRFSSSIQELDWVFVPQKDKKGGSSGETGVPGQNDPIYNFGDCIRFILETFSADYVIRNNELSIERRDRLEEFSNYKVPRVFFDQERLLDVYSFNADEIISNYLITFSYDTQDQNTLDDQTGRVYQAITKQKVTNDKELVTLKGVNEVQIPFSLAKDKQSLTAVERLARSLGRLVDRVTGVFGNGTNFANRVEERRGSMLLSSDFISVGKLVAMSGSNLALNQRTLINAKLLYDNYHFINSHAPINGIHNQFWIYKDIRVPMDLEDFDALVETNKFFDPNGVRVQMDRAVYLPEKGTATIDFRVNKLYTNNLTQDYVQ